MTYFIEYDEAKDKELIKKICSRTGKRLGKFKSVEDGKEPKQLADNLKRYYNPDFYVKSSKEYHFTEKTTHLKYGRAVENKQQC